MLEDNAPKRRIAIIYAATGAYLYFWEGFYRSFKERFVPEAEKDFFVFTDAETLFAEQEDPHIHKRYWKSLGWPYDTLYRFRMVLSEEEALRAFDYIFLFNANLVCLTEVSGKDFLPDGNRLVVVQHPKSNVRRPYKHPYDRNPASLAYVPYRCLDARHYVCGGINGGTAEAYLRMAREVDRRIRADEAHGVTALNNDESHFNRYVIDYPDYRLLGAEYAYPEGWVLPHGKRMMLLDKEKYITHPAGHPAAYREPFKNTGPLWLRAYRSIRARLYMAGKTAREKARDLSLEIYFRLHGR